jgi:hypothetical protein
MHIEWFVLAQLAGAGVFSNQIPGFLPRIGAASFHPGMMLPPSDGQQPAGRATPAVQIADIYQAAKSRAIEDHELDKLFNPEFYES